MPVRIGMGMNPHTVGLYNTGLLIFEHPFPGFSHGIHRIKNILAVTMQDTQVFKTGEIICHLTVSRLIGLWHRNTITIVLEHENDRQLFIGSTVNGFVNISFAHRRFAL